jgi:hypothetical protein
MIGNQKKRIFQKQEHVTCTEYWSYLNADENQSILKKYIKIKLIYFKNFIEKILNIKIHWSANNNINEAYKSYPVDQTIINCRNKKLSLIVCDFLSSLGINRECYEIEKNIIEYDAVFKAWPYKDLSGGMGYNNGLFVFCFARSIYAEEILESGIWRGYTTYILKNSICSAKHYCFDINLTKVLWKSESAEYFENDINQVSLSFSSDNRLALFDDHVSQYDRLLYANKNNFKYLIFDDDVSHFSLHSDGWPPLPTISMLKNIDNLPTKFEWYCNNIKGIASFNIPENFNMLDSYYYSIPPDIFDLTGYRNTSQTSYLVKKDNL